MIQQQIAAVLHDDWDPIGIRDEPACRDEYDEYVGGVYRLLASGASAAEVQRHLQGIERELMGFSGNRRPFRRRREVACLGRASQPAAVKLGHYPARRAISRSRCTRRSTRSARRLEIATARREHAARRVRCREGVESCLRLDEVTGEIGVERLLVAARRTTAGKCPSRGGRAARRSRRPACFPFTATRSRRRTRTPRAPRARRRRSPRSATPYCLPRLSRRDGQVHAVAHRREAHAIGRAEVPDRDLGAMDAEAGAPGSATRQTGLANRTSRCVDAGERRLAGTRGVIDRGAAACSRVPSPRRPCTCR